MSAPCRPSVTGYADTGRVIWISGLSGAGKSTLANELVSRLAAKDRHVVFFDGDELRSVFGAVESAPDNHSRDARLELAMKYSRLCRLIAQQGCTVVIATISLFREVHEWNRGALPGYFEVYLRVPLEELCRRDPKGIYHRYFAGEISHVAGLDVPIDEPQDPDMLIDFDNSRSVASITEDLMKKLKEPRTL